MVAWAIPLGPLDAPLPPGPPIPGWPTAGGVAGAPVTVPEPAEAMAMVQALKAGRNRFFVSSGCHPQTMEVVRTRAEALADGQLPGLANFV